MADLSIDEMRSEVRSLSAYRHHAYSAEFHLVKNADGTYPPDGATGPGVSLDTANLIGSGIVLRRDMHTVMLDIDHPVHISGAVAGKALISIELPAQPARTATTAAVAMIERLGISDAAAVAPLGENGHALMMRVQHHSRVLRSSSEGHHHLYVDAVLTWAEYTDLMVVLADLGAVEAGYLRASMQRRETHLRLPWITKAKSSGAERVRPYGASVPPAVTS